MCVKYIFQCTKRTGREQTKMFAVKKKKMSLNNKNSNKEVSKWPSRKRPSGWGLRVTPTGHFRGGQAPLGNGCTLQTLSYTGIILCHRAALLKDHFNFSRQITLKKKNLKHLFLQQI